MISSDRDEQDRGLPMPWYRYFTEDGEEYFFNDETGETTWSIPTVPVPKIAALQTRPGASAAERWDVAQSLVDQLEEMEATLTPRATAASAAQQRPQDTDSLPPQKEVEEKDSLPNNMSRRGSMPTEAPPLAPASNTMDELDEEEAPEPPPPTYHPTPFQEEQEEEERGENALLTDPHRRGSMPTEPPALTPFVHQVATDQTQEEPRPVVSSPPISRADLDTPSPTDVPACAEPVHALPVAVVVEEVPAPSLVAHALQPNPFDESDVPAPPISVAVQVVAQAATEPRHRLPERAPVALANPFAQAPVAQPPKKLSANSATTQPANPFLAPEGTSSVHAHNPFQEVDIHDRFHPSHPGPARPNNSLPTAAHHNPFQEAELHQRFLQPSAPEAAAQQRNPFAVPVPSPGSSILVALKTKTAAPPLAHGASAVTPSAPVLSLVGSVPGTKKKSSILEELQQGKAGEVRRPPPPPPKPSPITQPANATRPVQPALPARRSMVSAVAHSTHEGVANLAELSNEMLLMMQLGVRRSLAETFLLAHEYDLPRALAALNKQIRNELYTDPEQSMIKYWSPRLTVKIKSWLPNLMEVDGNDYHTGYVVTVTYQHIVSDRAHSWQVTLRYNKFKAINHIVNRYSHLTWVKAQFPSSGIGQWLMGISDETRYQRMDQFDSWLREITTSPVLMTTKDIADIVHETLQLSENNLQERR